MGITEQEAIKELQTRDEIFVAYSQATKLPYVICDQESFNDQVWVFATEEEIKAFDELPYNNKVCFTHKKYPQYKSTYYIHGSEDEKYLKSMMDYVHQWWIKRYYDQFDFVDWLNQGGCNWKGKE